MTIDDPLEGGRLTVIRHWGFVWDYNDDEVGGFASGEFLLRSDGVLLKRIGYSIGAGNDLRWSHGSQGRRSGDRGGEGVGQVDRGGIRPLQAEARCRSPKAPEGPSRVTRTGQKRPATFPDRFGFGSPYFTTTAVTIPNMPSTFSTWGRMWQCHTQVPGVSRFTSTE